MRVFLTGAGGFIGTWIGRQLLQDGHSVLGADDLSGGFLENIHKLENAHTKSDFSMFMGPCEYVSTKQMQEFGVDTVVHCAANAREGASQFQPFSVTKRNLFSYSAVMSQAISAGVKNFVIMSSMSVYGGGVKPPPFDEDQPLAPEDVYAVNKAAMERCTQILAEVHGLNYVIIRPHNVIGELQSLCDRYRNVAGIWMNKIMRDEQLTIFGDGNQTRAFSYIEDSMPSFMRAIYDLESVNGHAINVGGTIPVTINELCKAVCEEMGVGEDYPKIFLPWRPREVVHAHCSYEKSQRLLGYEEKVGWREGIRKMAAWAKEQGPQEWRDNEGLEIINEHTPSSWVKGGIGNQ